MDDIDCVRHAIYDIENELIQQKIFQDDSGRPRFITNLEIKNRTSLKPECAHLDDTQIVNAIMALDPSEFIVFNNNLGDIDQNPDIKFFIRSRTYHIIWVLYRSTNRTLSNVEFNVSDFQYVRHIKNRPKNDIELREVLRDPAVGKILHEQTNTWLDKVMAAIIKESKYKKISKFQLKSAITVLKDLDMCKRNSVPRGIVIEAGTGFGKSFAYQLPLLLWTLNKKINIIDDYHKRKIKLADLHVNCSALLIFPRNALAQDQYDNLNELITIINNVTSKSTDQVEIDVLHIKPPLRDFQSNISSELDKKYGDTDDGRPDIIITGPKSLERRLVNPKCAPVYKNGIDCVLYDEVHLWDGIEGAEVASLNGRLQNLFQEKAKKSPLFVGMSATIAKAETHCQKLFALMMRDKPKHITQAEEDETEPFSIEHHLILKPRSGRSPLGVAIDTTSSLIHNRRNGLQQSHDDNHGNQSHVDKKKKDKTLTFIDSLNLTGKFANKLNSFEKFYDGHAQKANNAKSWTPHRGYLFHWRPESRPPKGGGPRASFIPAHDCASCINKTSPEIFNCPSYARGECWYYSLDSGGQVQNPIYSNWHPFTADNRLTVPIDNIRSNKVTSLDRKLPKGFTKYDYFAFTGDNDWPRGKIWIPGQDGGQYITPFYTDIDNVVATSKLEVGVDFDNIKEIIQYGEIRSPSSYKQKAGRGAREGNTEDGLFVMTVIPDSALSYHHFKHFRRLVESSLDPLKLEPANPDVLKSNCYFSILEFLALNNVNLFTISKMTPNDVAQEFIKAINLLADPKLEKYLESFLNIFNQSDPKLIKEIIGDTKSFLDILSTEKEITIGGTKNKKTLHQWLIESVTDAEINKETQEQYGINVNTKKSNATNEILNSIQKLKDVYKEKFPSDAELAKLLDDYEKE